MSDHNLRDGEKRSGSRASPIARHSAGLQTTFLKKNEKTKSCSHKKKISCVVPSFLKPPLHRILGRSVPRYRATMQSVSQSSVSQSSMGELGSGWRCVKSEDYGQTYIFGKALLGSSCSAPPVIVFLALP